MYFDSSINIISDSIIAPGAITPSTDINIVYTALAMSAYTLSNRQFGRHKENSECIIVDLYKMGSETAQKGIMHIITTSE